MSDVKISSKMKKGIKLIQDNLHVRFTGKSFEDAKKFLDEYLPKLQNVDFRESKKPSEKQLKGIAFIQVMLGIEFTGSTMKDASEFISQYFEDAKSKADSIKERKKG